MYPEFIAIYVMLVIVIGLLGAVLFFLLKLLKNGSFSNNNNSYMPMQQINDQYYEQQYQTQYQEQYQPQYQQQYQQQGGGIVFCKQCATQFDSSQAYCPNCGTRR
jgi:hypothetical protein